MSTQAFSGPVRDPAHDDDLDEQVESGSIEDIGTAIAAVDRASIDSQIATAHRYPRSITKCIREAIGLATMDEETAASMMYSLKRAGKVIEGPSARLAEVISYSWTNLRAESDIVGEDAKWVTAMGTCFDLEKNVAIRTRVRRRITDKHGKRFNDDMIGTTSNAAASIALRNAVFKVIPRALVQRVYDAARKASLGKGGTMTQKRQAALDWWAKMGVSAEQIFTLVGVQGLDDIGEDQLITLRGFANAVKDGEQSVEDLFRPSDKSDGTQDLNAALGNGGNGKGAAPAEKAKASGGKKAEPTPSASTTSATSSAPTGRACVECGGVDGKHSPDCRYFAD